VTRRVYSWLMWLIQPLVRLRLWHRGRVEPDYRVAMAQRFGRYQAIAGARSADTTHQQAFVWVHAVSLGETRVAAPLITRLREQLPGMRLLLTHGTATGRAEGGKLLRPGDVQVWQPWDTQGNVKRFLDHFKPRIGILLETEVWPNLCAQCQTQGIPLVLVNARMSEKSLRLSQRLGWLAGPAYTSLAAVWAQTGDDAQRLQRLGAPVQGVFGNLKFDANPDPAQLLAGQQARTQLGSPVLLLASSREGEEQEFLRVCKQNGPQAPVKYTQLAIKNVANDVQCLIVPRHPQRFDEVAALVQGAGFSLLRRSHWQTMPPLAAKGAASMWLGDSLGEMAMYYGLADLALLGGSFEPLGGQNLIEAAACGCPVILGPHTFNFAQAAELAIAAGAAIRVPSMVAAVQEAQQLLRDGKRLLAMRQAALAFAAAHRGAMAKTVAAIVQRLG
jgi:3-deoxy-D-manno-octulosonic-acid transferase